MRLRIGLFALPLALASALVACSSNEPSEGEPARASSAAASTGYTFELRARASEDPGRSAFGVPAGAFLKNLTPSLSSHGHLAIAFLAFDGLEHVWTDGAIVHDVPDPKGIVTGVSVNDRGDVAFDVMEGSSGNGIWIYRADTQATSFFTSEPLGADGWINVALSNAGRVGCRAGAGGVHFLGFPDEKGFTKLAVETATNPNSKYAWLFTPSFDERDRAAAKVQLASGGNEIRIFAQGTQPITIAQDQGASPTSPFASIDNGVALSDGGAVAFVAKAKATGKRGVYRSDGTTTTRIALEGEGGVATIAFFTPAINAAGRVVFKGYDAAGKNAIWAGDGAALEEIVATGDALPTDRGTSFALPETEVDPSNTVVFGGGVAIDAAGEVAFLAALADASGARLGTGVFVARPRP